MIINSKAKSFCFGILAVAATSVSAFAEIGRLNIMIISGPGSGQDQMARAVTDTLRAEGLASGAKIEPVIGGAGSAALVRFMRNGPENGTALYGLGASTVIFTTINKTEVKPLDLAPIVRLVGDYPVMAVRADSEIKTLNDLLDRIKKDPGGVKHGGGEAGTADHIFYARLADRLGVDVKRINHIAHPNSGEVVVSLLSKQVDVTTGTPSDYLGQVAAGKVRFLAIAAPQRVAGVDAPTFRELGIDLVMPVSRGYLAHPQATTQQKAELEAMFAKLHDSPRWKALLKERGWEDQYLPAAEYKTFIEAETAALADILGKLGFIKN